MKRPLIVSILLLILILFVQRGNAQSLNSILEIHLNKQQ